MGPLLRRIRAQASLLLLGLAACASPAASLPPTPELSVCGDARVQSGEECDDGNTNEQDGCLRSCLLPASWVSSDPHIHSHGCSGDLSPKELLEVSNARGTQVTAALVWGDGYDDDKGYFTGRDDPASRPGNILHYDMEISAFPAADSGHLLLLGLNSIRFSPDPFHSPHSGIPVADWALGQGPRGVVGMAHGQFWPPDGSFPRPPVACCMPWDFIPDAVLGRASFIETERRDDGPPVDPGTDKLFTTLQNAGVRVALAGGSDYPCIHHFIADQTPRTDVRLEGEISYERWLEALKHGRSAVVVGGPGNHLDMRVNGFILGDELRVRSGSTVRLDIEAAAPLAETVQILANGAPVASVALDPGHQSASVKLGITRSVWLSAMSPFAKTSPIYVVADGAPIRGPASDICYLIRYLDHLTGLVRSRKLDLAPETDLAVAEYARARSELLIRFNEAGGTTCS